MVALVLQKYPSFTPDQVKARLFYDQACAGNEYNGCQNLGIVWANGDGGATIECEERRPRPLIRRRPTR